MKKVMAIFMVSFILQAVCIFLAAAPVENDARVYDTITVNLLSGKGFSLDGVSPAPAGYVKQGYILFLAVIFGIFGHNILLVKFIQAILLALSCVVTYKLGVEIFNQRLGYISGLVMACHPVFLIISSHLVSEGLFTLLLLLSILYLSRAMRERSWKQCVLSGLLLGIANQVRLTTIFFPFFVAAGLLFLYKEKKQALQFGSAVIVLTGLIALPWFIRGYVTSGQVNPVADYGGALWMGSYTKGRGYQDNPEFKKIAAQSNREFNERHIPGAMYKPRTQVERQSGFINMALANIKNDPWGYSSLFPVKILRLWTGSYAGFFRIDIGFAEFRNPAILVRHPFVFFWKSFVFFYSLAVFYLGLAGMFLGLKLWRQALPLYLVVLYFTLLHMVVYANCRLGIPALPYMILFAVSGWDFMGRKISNALGHSHSYA